MSVERDFAPVELPNHSARGLRRIPGLIARLDIGTSGGSAGLNCKAGTGLNPGLRFWSANRAVKDQANRCKGSGGANSSSICRSNTT